MKNIINHVIIAVFTGLLISSIEEPHQEEPVVEEVIVMQKELTKEQEWELLYETICWVETKTILGVNEQEKDYANDPKLKGKDKDWGIIQITPIYVKEVNRILGKEKYKHEDAFDITKSREMFDIVQNHRNPEKDLNKAIRLHNKHTWYAERIWERFEQVKEEILNQC